MDILILYENRMITARTYQICIERGLDTIESLENYLSINGDFSSLVDSGKTTNIELLDLLGSFSNPYGLEIFKGETKLLDLYQEGLISSNSLDFCNINNFLTINDLKKYLNTSSDFTSLNNCDFIINHNLLKIVAFEKIRASKFENFSVLERGVSNVLDSSKMSVRAYKVCIDNQLTTIEELYKYYEIHGNFSRLPNCGAKTNDELIKLVGKKKPKSLEVMFEEPIVLHSDLDKLWHVNNEDILLIANSLTKRDRDSINCFINLLLSSISNQTVSLLSTHYEMDFRVKKILSKEKLINQVGRIKGIKVGSKYHKEVLFFYEQVFKNIILMRDNPLKAKQQFLEVLADKWKVNKDVLKDIDLQHYSGLKTIDFLINNNLIFGDKTEINLKCLEIYDDFKSMTLEEVGNIFDVTRERIRQIRLKGLTDLDESLKALIYFFSEDLYVGWSFEEEGLITMSNSIVSQLNRKYEVNFSKDFLTYLFSIASDRHSIIPNVNVSFLARLQSQNTSSFNNFYLINKEQSKKLDFNSMISDVKTRKNERIEETYSLNFDNYLRKFLHAGIDLDDELIKICEKVIMQEANIFINIYNELEFQRNVVKTVPDYAYEILKEIGRPAKISYMYELLLEKYPDFDRPENTFRGCFNLDNRFVPIGRQSVWGLKEWEDEREDFMGGSMLEIAENILQNSEVPMHISEISNEIAKYRDIDEARLMSNLRYNNKRGFIFFAKQYVGLKSKKYTDDFDILKKDNRTWEESYLKLSEFVNRNNRLPRANDDDQSARLYRWYGIQKRRYLDEGLDPEKLEKIGKIISDFDSWSIYE